MPLTNPKYIDIVNIVQKACETNPMISDTQMFGDLLLEECYMVLANNGYDDALETLKNYFNAIS
jgi:hypothetical protein